METRTLTSDPSFRRWIPLTALEYGGALGAVGGYNRTDRQPRYLLLLPAVDGFGGLVPTLDLAVGVDTDDGVGDVGHQAGPVTVGRLGRPALGHVAGDDLVGRFAGPGGADAGELHHLDLAAGEEPTDLAVLEELTGLGELGQSFGHIGDVVGIGEVGHQRAVVLGEGLGVLLVGFGADHATHGPVAIDEAAVLMDEDDVGGDFGQQTVAVDQLAQLPLEPALAGDVHSHADVEHALVIEGGTASGIGRRGHGVVGDGHGGSPHHHVVDDPVRTTDVDVQVEFGEAHAMTDGSQDGGEELLAGVGAGDEVGVGVGVIGGSNLARIALSIVPNHGEAPDSLLEAEELFDRGRPHDCVAPLVVHPGHRLDLGAGQFDALGKLEGAVTQGSLVEFDPIEGDPRAPVAEAARSGHRPQISARSEPTFSWQALLAEASRPVLSQPTGAERHTPARGSERRKVPVRIRPVVRSRCHPVHSQPRLIQNRFRAPSVGRILR